MMTNKQCIIVSWIITDVIQDGKVQTAYTQRCHEAARLLLFATTVPYTGYYQTIKARMDAAINEMPGTKPRAAAWH